MKNFALAGLFVTCIVNAQNAPSHGHARAVKDLVDGEVQLVDKAGGNITLRHAEIRNMQMPAMTMTFNVKEPALLDKVRQGDRVKFKVEAVDGVPKVTALELVK